MGKQEAPPDWGESAARRREEEPASPSLKAAGIPRLSASAIDSCEHMTIGHCGPDCGGGSHDGGEGVGAVSNLVLVRSRP